MNVYTDSYFKTNYEANELGEYEKKKQNHA